MSVWNLQIVLSSISFGLVADKILRGLGQGMTMWFVFVWFLTSVFLRCPCLFKDAQNMDAVMTRLRRFEDAQKATVDSCLEEFRHLIKSPMFTKDRALDRLLNLKMVAKEANHPKSGFFEAVFRALREKTGATDVQFTKYLEVLLGDKDHETVLESIAKVDKAMRISSPPASRGFSYYRGAGRVNRSSV